MKKHISKLKSYIIAHKIISGVVLIILLFTVYSTYKKLTGTASNVRYVTAKVEKGIIVASISGSGQVSAFNQVDVKAKVSGEVAYLVAQAGQRIGAGGLIAVLDAKDTQKSVRDAEINLESAQISLEKLKLEKSKENLNTDLAQSYDTAFNTISDVFLDLPETMTGLNNMFFGNSINTGQWNIDWYEGQVGPNDFDKVKTFKQSFTSYYNKAKKSYEANLDAYKSISRTSKSEEIEALILETYNTTKLVSDTIKNANNFIDFVNSSIENNNFDTPAVVTTDKALLNGYTSQINTHLVSLLSTTTSIKEYKDAFLNADLDIQSSQLSVKQKENALRDAKEKLADYFIRAPFEGSITKINIKKSDSLSAGTIVTTLITKRQLAEISMNEIDVAKLKVGQKATLTFDAVPDLTINGVVADIDTLGTVSQGVVTYIVKISFATQDERIKPGMSVSSDIITDMKENVLVVPNSSVKAQAGKNYIEKNNSAVITRVPVTVGIANDTEIEIISGIVEGEEIIVRTILPTTTSATAPSIFGSAPGSRGTGGGNVRTQVR